MAKSAVLNLVKIGEKEREGGLLRIFRAWTIPIIRSLGEKSPKRFNQLKREVKGISSTSLSERLSGLEADGILQRVVIPDNPPMVEYSLTAKGMELYTIIVELGDWADKWSENSE